MRLRRGPQLAEALDRQLPRLAALGVHRVLEAVHRDLAEHRRDLVLEVRREQREPFLRVGDLLEQATERDRLAEHRRGLGQRQRRRLVEDALAAREVRVQAVTELVREREHVAPARGPVQQHVRMVRRHRVRAERARALPGPGRRVDPRAVEEALRGVGELARERAVRVEHELLRRRASRSCASTSATDAMRS